MPVYEYRCGNCGRRFSALIGMTSEPDSEVCPACGGSQCDRMVSKFARGRTEDQRMDELADAMDASGEPESPAQMRALVREMGKAMDEDMGDQMEEMFETDMEGD